MSSLVPGGTIPTHFVSDVLRDAQSLMSIPSVTGTPEAVDAQWAFARQLDRLGLRPRLHPTPAGPVVSAVKGRPDDPLVIWLGHTDVVPGAPEQFWPSVDGDRLVGRGSVDMKLACALMAHLLHAWPGKPGLQVGLMVVSDEERVWPKSIVDPSVQEMYRRAEFVIAGEPPGPQIGVAAKGFMHATLEMPGVSAKRAIESVYPLVATLPFTRIRTLRYPGGATLAPTTLQTMHHRAVPAGSDLIRIVVRGRSEHSSVADPGENPILTWPAVIAALGMASRIGEPLVVAVQSGGVINMTPDACHVTLAVPSRLGLSDPARRQALVEDMRQGALAERSLPPFEIADAPEPATGPPGRCSLGLSIRHLAGQTRDGIVDELEALSGHYGLPRFTVDVGTELQPFSVPDDHPHVLDLVHAWHGVRGPGNALAGRNGGSDLPWLRLLGAEMGLKGWGHHRVDEWASIGDVVPYAEVLWAYLERRRLSVAGVG
jgi:acetylornithine deacetylase/succinyl-diaminopimelate desuccinylase-like protein